MNAVPFVSYLVERGDLEYKDSDPFEFNTRPVLKASERKRSKNNIYFRNYESYRFSEGRRAASAPMRAAMTPAPVSIIPAANNQFEAGVLASLQKLNNNFEMLVSALPSYGGLPNQWRTNDQMSIESNRDPLDFTQFNSQTTGASQIHQGGTTPDWLGGIGDMDPNPVPQAHSDPSIQSLSFPNPTQFNQAEGYHTYDASQPYDGFLQGPSGERSRQDVTKPWNYYGQ
jgi:hypothetical protein